MSERVNQGKGKGRERDGGRTAVVHLPSVCLSVCLSALSVCSLSLSPSLSLSLSALCSPPVDCLSLSLWLVWVVLVAGRGGCQ